MPSFYTHNAFGRDVYSELPKELKAVVRKYPKAFKAGLQGPDFLFFYRPFLKSTTNRLGYNQHGQPFIDFLTRIRPIFHSKGKDCGEYAYMLGFICHFILDSESHTYIYEKVKEPGYNHLVMEIELDRHLMKRDGKNPLLYPAWKHINWDRETLDAIHGIYNYFEIPREKIKKSLRSMSFIKWFLTTGRTFRRIFIRFVMFVTGKYKELEGHMMALVPKKTSLQTNRILEQIYKETIPLCTELLVDFDRVILTNEPFHERFKSTFKNNDISGASN